MLTTVNKIHQIQHNYFSHHSGFMEIVGLLSPHTLQTSGKMVCVCVEWGECCYYSMCENEMALHLTNRTSSHLVETEACPLKMERDGQEMQRRRALHTAADQLRIRSLAEVTLANGLPSDCNQSN